MKRKPRTRAAHLGKITVEGSAYWVTYRAGWIHFHRYRSRSPFRSLALPDVFNLAETQRTFAFIPKA